MKAWPYRREEMQDRVACLLEVSSHHIRRIERIPKGCIVEHLHGQWSEKAHYITKKHDCYRWWNIAQELV